MILFTACLRGQLITSLIFFYLLFAVDGLRAQLLIFSIQISHLKCFEHVYLTHWGKLGHVGEIASLGWPGNASQKRVRAGGGSWGERTLAQTRISGRKWMYGCNEMLKKKKKIVCLLYSRFKSVTITTGGS